MMTCRHLRSSFADLELELARPEERIRLEAHLAGCATCASWVAAERRLTASLVSLRTEMPFEIDVTARVRARLGRLAPAARSEVSVREFAWSAAAVGAFSVGLLLGLWRLAPALVPLVAEARATLDALGSAASTLLAPVAALISTAVKASGSLLASLGSVAGAIEALQPVAIGMVVLCALMMTASIVLVVRRDLQRPRWIQEEPRP